MLRIILLPMLLLIVFQTYGQQIITFRLNESNNILLKTLVNDQDSLVLMFQIAMEDAAISPDRINAANHLNFKESDVSVGNKIQVGEWTCTDLIFYDNQLSAKGSDGKVGTKLFKDKSFKINYDQERFEIFDQLPNVEGYEAIPIRTIDGVYFLTVNSTINGKELAHQFYLQTGYAGGLLYDNVFSDLHDLKNKLNIIKSTTLKNASGKEVITNDAIITSLSIGPWKLADVAVGFFAGELKTQQLSLFGADLMKRFNWIFDVDRKIAYIRPSKYFEAISYLHPKK